MNSSEVLEILSRHYPQRSGAWVFVKELSITGAQRIDAFAIGCWASNHYERHAFEIKCSRGDLRNELANPYKRQQAMGLSDRFYFVIASDVRWDDLEIPADCGIMVASGRGITKARIAPHRQAPPAPASFVAWLARRASGWLLNPPAGINEWGQVERPDPTLVLPGTHGGVL